MSEQTQLTAEERSRYARQIVLPEIGATGQGKLKAARVLVVGVGGLGSPAALYLAAAGVGTLGLADFDRVEESNLQRQILFAERDAGRMKVDAAAERLRAQNSGAKIEPHTMRVDAGSADALIREYDVIVDGSDNLATRYALSDACARAGKPHVYGSVDGWQGQASVFAPGGPCYRCLYPEAPMQPIANCAENGVLGATAGVIAMIQAAETVKWILSAPGLLAGRVLVVDTWSASFREYKLSKNSDCANHSTGMTAAQQEKRPMAEKIPQMPVEELKRRIDAGDAPFVLDVRETHEHARAHLKDSGAEVKLIPLGELPARVHELDPERETVVHCKSGGRSQSAAEHLQAAGFKKVHNLAGGINAWSDRVDPKVPKY